MRLYIYRLVKIGHRAQKSMAELRKCDAQDVKIGGRFLVLDGRNFTKQKAQNISKNRWPNS